MSDLVLNELSKTYRTEAGEICALQKLSLKVEAGELISLVGPSGCGKTTTLRLIAGLENPTSGSISIAGKPVTNLAAKDRDVAMVFQSPALFPHLTVFENIGFGLKLRKLSEVEIKKLVQEASEMLGLNSKLNCRPSELSGGEAQRVALGRALVRRPKVFLLDEPLSSVDAPMRKQLRLEILKVQKHLSVPMIYVTHDQHEAFSMGKRIVVLNAGMVQQIGTAEELRGKPANPFVSDFFNHE